MHVSDEVNNLCLRLGAITISLFRGCLEGGGFQVTKTLSSSVGSNSALCALGREFDLYQEQTFICEMKTSVFVKYVCSLSWL